MPQNIIKPSPVVNKVLHAQINKQKPFQKGRETTINKRNLIHFIKSFSSRVLLLLIILRASLQVSYFLTVVCIIIFVRFHLQVDFECNYKSHWKF